MAGLMTLSEYLAQENPVRMPQVLLSEGEYQLSHYHGVIGLRVAAVFLPAIDACYCVKEGNPRLYTIDQDGNPKSPSCFYLPE